MVSAIASTLVLDHKDLYIKGDHTKVAFAAGGAVYVEHGTVVLDKIDFELATVGDVLIVGEDGISLLKILSFKAGVNGSIT